MIPIFAQRAALPPRTVATDEASGKLGIQHPMMREIVYAGAEQLPGWAKVVGGTGVAVAVTSVVWFFAGRPEYGGLPERMAHVQYLFETDRVFPAFVLDFFIYSIMQVALLERAVAW